MDGSTISTISDIVSTVASLLVIIQMTSGLLKNTYGSIYATV